MSADLGAYIEAEEKALDELWKELKAGNVDLMYRAIARQFIFDARERLSALKVAWGSGALHGVTPPEDEPIEDEGVAGPLEAFIEAETRLYPARRVSRAGSGHEPAIGHGCPPRAGGMPQLECLPGALVRLPIRLLLTCPVCSKRHVDEGEHAERLHHTHACDGCGHVWRPAKEATVGVRFLDPPKPEARSDRVDALGKEILKEMGGEPGSLAECKAWELAAGLIDAGWRKR